MEKVTLKYINKNKILNFNCLVLEDLEEKNHLYFGLKFSLYYNFFYEIFTSIFIVYFKIVGRKKKSYF
jgi:hypothetical protein